MPFIYGVHKLWQFWPLNKYLALAQLSNIWYSWKYLKIGFSWQRRPISMQTGFERLAGVSAWVEWRAAQLKSFAFHWFALVFQNTVCIAIFWCILQYCIETCWCECVGGVESSTVEKYFKICIELNCIALQCIAAKLKSILKYALQCNIRTYFSIALQLAGVDGVESKPAEKLCNALLYIQYNASNN